MALFQNSNHPLNSLNHQEHSRRQKEKIWHVWIACIVSKQMLLNGARTEGNSECKPRFSLWRRERASEGEENWSIPNVYVWQSSRFSCLESFSAMCGIHIHSFNFRHTAIALFMALFSLKALFSGRKRAQKGATFLFTLTLKYLHVRITPRLYGCHHWMAANTWHLHISQSHSRFRHSIIFPRLLTFVHIFMGSRQEIENCRYERGGNP